MKTKRGMYEGNLQKTAWLGIKDVIICCTILLALIIVAIWKYEVYTTSIISASKWSLLSIESGFCLGNVISWLVSSEWILQLKRDHNHRRTQNCWAKRQALEKFTEENPDDKKAKIRLKKVEYRLEKLGVISKLLTNPYERV